MKLIVVFGVVCIAIVLLILMKLFKKKEKDPGWELHFVDGKVMGHFQSEKDAEDALKKLGCKPFQATAVRKRK